MTLLPSEGAYRWIRVASYVLVYCTVFIKPIIYVCSNKFFKEAFYDTFPFLKSKDKEDIQLDKLETLDSSDVY